MRKQPKRIHTGFKLMIKRNDVWETAEVGFHSKQQAEAHRSRKYPFITKWHVEGVRVDNRPLASTAGKE